MDSSKADVVAEVSELKSMGLAFEEIDVRGFKTVDGVANMNGIMASCL